MDTCDALQKALGYNFQRQELLKTALTHSSWANEHRGNAKHNERQEFLGDAVLELCVSWELFTLFSKAREGDLTRLRSRLVSATALAHVARQVGIDRYIRLGRGEEGQGGRQRDNILSDAFEAILGAVFEDGGYAAAQQVVRHVFAGHWPAQVGENPHKDYKTLLQEVIQKQYKDRPLYVLKSSEGPEHAKSFEVQLTLPNGHIFFACGQSLKRAEQEAARTALEFCLAQDGVSSTD